MRRPRPHVSQLAMSTAGCRAQARGSRGRDARSSRDTRQQTPDSAIQSARAWTVDGVWLGW